MKTEKIPWKKAIENIVTKAVDNAMVRLRVDYMDGIYRKLYLYYSPCTVSRMGALRFIDGDVIPSPDWILAWPEPVRLTRDTKTDLRNFAKAHLGQLPLLAQDLVI